LANKKSKPKTESELLSSLKKDALSPIYFFTGSESIRISKAVKAIREEVLKSAEESSTAWTSYNLAETGFDTFLADIKTVSFFGGRRGVEVTNFCIPEKNKNASGYALNDEEQAKLVGYCENPSTDVRLILRPERANFTQTFWKKLKSASIFVKFETSKKDEAGTIALRIKESSLSFESKATIWMQNRFTGAIKFLDSELEKLESYKGDDKSVSVKDLENCMTTPKSEEIWAVTGAVGTRNIKKTMEALASLKVAGEHPTVILSLVARQFRMILHYKSLAKKGLPQNEISLKLGFKNGWIPNDYTSQAGKMTTTTLKKILCRLSMIDLRTKNSGKFNIWTIFEEEIINLLTSFPTVKKSV